MSAARVCDLYREGVSPSGIAEQVGLSQRHVLRLLTAAGLRKSIKRHRYTPDELSWANELAREGVPTTWIAETLGVSVDGLRPRISAARSGAEGSSFRAVWPQIAMTPALLELHHEFAPRARRE